MGLVFHRQTGMFRRAVLRLIEDVFSSADEFHNCQGEIRKSDGSALRRVTRKDSSARALASAGKISPQRAAISTIRCHRSGERRMRRNEGTSWLFRYAEVA